MSQPQLLEDKVCFICEKAGYKDVKVDLEKVGTKPDGKAIWKPYEAGKNIEHQHKGSAQKVNQAQEFKEIKDKLDKVLEILNEIRGQKTL